MTSLNKKRIAAGICIVLIVACYVFYKNYKSGFLQKKLPALVQHKTKGLYQISYASISVDELGGNLAIRNLCVVPDTALQQQLLFNHDSNAAKVLVDVYIPHLKVVSFKTAKALLSNQIECRQVVIDSPQVRIYLFPGQAKQKDFKTQKQELYKQILGNLHMLHADSVSITNASVTAIDFFTKEIKFQTLQTTAGLHDVAIDSLSNDDTSRTFFCKEIKLGSNKIFLGEKGKSAEITNAVFDTRSQLLQLGRFEYNAFKNQGFFLTTATGISFRGIGWTGPVEHSALSTTNAVIEKVEIEMQPQESTKSSEKKTNQAMLSGWMKALAVNSLTIKSAGLTLRNSKQGEKPLSILNSALLIKNLHVDSTDTFGNSLLSKAKEVEITNTQISLKSSDGLYEYRLSGLLLNTFRKTFSAKAIGILPQYGEAEFSRRKQKQADRYDIAFRNVLFSDVDMAQLIKGGIYAGQASASNSSAKIFHDLTYPIDSALKESDRERFPHQLLCRADVPISIKRFRLNNTYIEYKEKETISLQSGRVRFSHANLVLNNITNQNLQPGSKATVHFTASFMEKVSMKGSFIFDLYSWKQGIFSAEVSTLNNMEAGTLNELTQPMSLVKIESGTIGPITFNLAGNSTKAQGALHMPYEKLKLSVLKRKDNAYHKKNVISLFANLIVKNKNETGENFRIAHIENTRNIYRSFFNFIWMGIFKGLKQTMVLKL